MTQPAPILTVIVTVILTDCGIVVQLLWDTVRRSGQSAIGTGEADPRDDSRTDHQLLVHPDFELSVFGSESLLPELTHCCLSSLAAVSHAAA